MSSAPIGKQPTPGTSIDEHMIPLRDQASENSAKSLKSILKRRLSSTTAAPQSRTQTKKFVRFALNLESDRARVAATLSAMKRPRRLASAPPVTPRITSPAPQYYQSLSSSAGIASSQLVEIRGRLAKAGRDSSPGDIFRQWKQKPQAKTQPQAKHQPLTMEDLAALPEQKKSRGRRVDGVNDDGDDTASNTDFELAVRMKRRWL